MGSPKEGMEDKGEMMAEVAVEEVLRIHRERWNINKLGFRDIMWTYQGRPLDIPVDQLDNWYFTGLNNMDFITSNYLRNRPWQEELAKIVKGE